MKDIRCILGVHKYQDFGNLAICQRHSCLDMITMSTPNHEVGHEKGLSIGENKNTRRNKTNNMTWDTAEKKGVTFTTPKGNYCPQSDDLVAEIKAAARYAGLKHPIVKVGNDVIDNPEDLTADFISELEDGTVVSVSAYDIAG